MARQTILQNGSGADLFTYWHIEGSFIRDQAKRATKDTVVSELWGNGTSAYRSVLAGYGGWKKYVADVAKASGKKAFAHTCVTTWSAGSELLKALCRGADLPDAIVSLDGIYGSKPPGSKAGDGNVLFDAGVESIAQYALAAARGEKIFVLLHSAIATPYGSSGEMAARIRRFVEDELQQEMQPDTSLTAADLDKHAFTEAFVLGNFHLIEFPGRDAKEHVAEAHLFDEVWTRWIPWARDDSTAPAEPVAVPAQDTTLGPGSKGPAVGAWQLFLVGRGAQLVVDEKYGPKTTTATTEFQDDQRLPMTGRLDAQTLAAARRMGFGEPAGGPPLPIESHSPAWPPRPTFPPMTGNAARDALFGALRFEAAPTPGNPEGIRILDGWIGANIVTVTIPQLRGIVGAPKNCQVQVHRIVAPRVIELFARWEREKLMPLVKTWAGSFAPRFVRGSRTTLSNHAYGSAFDINAAWNPLGAVPALVGRVGSVRELVPIANELGFGWGGHYQGRPDGMHIELWRV